MVDKGSSKLQKFCITIFLKGFSLENVNGCGGLCENWIFHNRSASTVSILVIDTFQ